MASLLYHWNFTSNSLQIHASTINSIIYDSESNLQAKVISRNTLSSSTVTRDENGITLNNVDGTSAGIIIDLLGLDSVNYGGNLTFEMVIKNTDRTKDSIYFQSIREYIDTNGNGLDDNLGIKEEGFNRNSASITLRYDESDSTKIRIRPDSIVDATAKDNSRITYKEFKSADSGETLDDSNFHHYIFTIEHNASDSKNLQIYIDGTEKGSDKEDLEKVVSDAVRQYNVIGSQKNPSGSTYLSGTIKYFKIYQGAMTDSEVSDTYNNYNTAPYYDDISSGTDEKKFIRRHTKLNDYFTGNPNVTTFIMTGNQLGLSNSSANYKIHKFVNEGSITINNENHYIPLKGENQFIIFKNGSDWYKITQTSANSNVTDARYKYQISRNSGIDYEAAVTEQEFGDSFTDGEITITFGGVEVTYTPSNICILEDSYIETDQGNLLIQNLTTQNTIHKLPVLDIYRSLATQPFVCIKKHSLGYNIPSRDTYLSNKHLLYDRSNNLLMNSEEFIDETKIIQANINKQKYCYHILLSNWSLLKVNNLECESLCCINNISINFYKENKIYKESFIDILRKQSKLIYSVNDIYVKGNKIMFKNNK